MDGLMREPAVAGRFYTNNPRELRDFVENALDSSKRNVRVRALIVPHAGYSFSGGTAGKAYSCVDGSLFDRVILLGPAHTYGFSGVSVAPYDSYATPLGELEVDTDLRDRLMEHSLVSSLAAAHRSEHCLEVQLPFIQVLNPSCKILPIVVGYHLSQYEAKMVGDLLKQEWTERTLIVISSDFTHYGASFGYSPFPSSEAQEMLPELDGDAIAKILAKDISGYHEYLEKTEATICGRNAIAVLLSMLDEEMDMELLEYTNSGSMTGDFSTSVSYASIVVLGSHYNEAEKRHMLKVARDAIFARLNGEDFQAEAVSDKLMGSGCCFVTLRIGGELRGCVGCLEPREALIESIAHNAINAAFCDTRFQPLDRSEYDRLEYHISILTPSRDVDSVDDIVLGKHGITLRAQGRRSVFLPEVPIDQGWDLTTTLEFLSRKAGLESDAWKEASFSVFETVSFGD